MSETVVTDHQLLGFLDEMLSANEMVTLENALRNSESLRRRAAVLLQQRDQGAHSIGEIWRRWRLTCPSRGQLGQYLLGTLDRDTADFLDFHIRTVGCRLCAANLQDLEQASASNEDVPNRRRKFYESSVGFLPSSHEKD
jgi:hypothetical protein